MLTLERIHSLASGHSELEAHQCAGRVANAVDDAGLIDVPVNNAGFGMPSPIELTEPEMARTLFETNTLGTLAMIQAVVPAFRQRRAGVIINVTSSTTLKPLPLVGLYRASKAAVNALTESLGDGTPSACGCIWSYLDAHPRRNSRPMPSRICVVVTIPIMPND
ncbi:MAG: SDR family NAD(P)-dependent oxidoreductase [Hyphomicrobiales bacterium]|nr:SDR family NAD(P)-dependent oxidoreductase [Hyphomicrobiales bacterium]